MFIDSAHLFQRTAIQGSMRSHQEEGAKYVDSCGAETWQQCKW